MRKLGKFFVVSLGFILGSSFQAMQRPQRPPRPQRPFMLTQPYTKTIPLQSQSVQAAQMVMPNSAGAERAHKKADDPINYKKFLRQHKRNFPDSIEMIKEELLKRDYELGIYAKVCIEFCESDPLDCQLIPLSCFLLSWQITRKYRKNNGIWDIREMFFYLYSNFERGSNERIIACSKRSCCTLATYLFNMLLNPDDWKEWNSASENDKRVLGAFLSRRDDEPVLQEVLMDIPRMSLDEAMRELQILVTQEGNRAEVDKIERGEITANDESAIQFEALCAQQALSEIRNSVLAEARIAAFQKKYCSNGQGKNSQAKLKSMRDKIAQRKESARAWLEESRAEREKLLKQFTIPIRRKYGPSIFTPIANFFRNRYLHYGCLLIAGIVVGVYGYWAYRKIFQKNPAQLARV